VHHHTNRRPPVAGWGGLFELVFAQEAAPVIETDPAKTAFSY
jgi:hypothetical protein